MNEAPNGQHNLRGRQRVARTFAGQTRRNSPSLRSGDAVATSGSCTCYCAARPAQDGSADTPWPPRSPCRKTGGPAQAGSGDTRPPTLTGATTGRNNYYYLDSCS